MATNTTSPAFNKDSVILNLEQFNKQYDKALLELQNNIIESKSPDLDRLQSIQRVEFFVNLIKSELCKPASLPDLEIIKKSLNLNRKNN